MTKERIAVLEEIRDLVTAKIEEIGSRPVNQRVSAYCALVELHDEVEELIHASVNARRERLGR